MKEALIKEIRVGCPREHAFRVFTERVNDWWPRSHHRLADSTLSIELWSGGRFFEATASGEIFILGQMIEIVPSHSLIFTWNPGKLMGPTRVEVRFVSSHNETLVTIVHTAGDAEMDTRWTNRVHLFDANWDEVLQSFIKIMQKA